MSLLTTLLGGDSGGGGGGSAGTILAPVVAATTSNLAASYNNGSSGVSATLTNSGAQAALTLDGVTLAAGNRVLIKNQTNQFENGIYLITTLGSGSENWVLTRTTDFDQATEITPGVVVQVTSGTVNALTLWTQTATVTVIGTDSIVFAAAAVAGLTPSRGVVTDASGRLATSATTSTEIGYVNGVTSAIQTQLDSKANTSSLGTMASQNANSVSITGGNVDNVIIGTSLLEDCTLTGAVVTSGNLSNVTLSSTTINSSAIDSATITNSSIDGGTIDNVTDFSAGNYTINGVNATGQYAGGDLLMGVIDGGGNDRATLRTDSGGTTGIITVADSSANTLVITPTSLVTNGTFSRILPAATQGDLLYASATNTWSNLAKNTTTSRYLANNGTNNSPQWSTVSLSTGVAGILQFDNGGLGLNTAAQGDILYASAANTLSTLAKSAIPSRYLKNSGTNNNPQWAALDVSSVTGELPWLNINVPLSVSGKNLILNGDFQVSQSGTSFSVAASSNSYTIDRWQLKTSASQASTVTQVAGATSGSFQAKVQRNSGQTGTGALSFGTSLTRSMCIGAAGNPLTLTVRLKAGANFSAASSELTVQVISGTGSSDVSSLTTGFTGSNTELSLATAITTTETEYTFGLANLGSSVTQLYVGFTYNPVGTAGADDSFTVSDVKLELGENSTPFIHEPLQDVLPKIYYFHYRLEFNNNGAARFGIMGQAVSTTSAQFAFQHLTTMRVAPTFTSGTVTNFQVTAAAGPGIATTNLVSSQMFPNSALLVATVASGLAAGGSTQLLTVSNANAWLDFSAELT